MIKLRSLLRDAEAAQVGLNGRWYPARPWRVTRKFKQVAYDLYLVIRGRADVVVWPEDEVEYNITQISSL